jgi:hypothetical protein
MTSLLKYNKSQLAILCTVKDEFKHYLGEEINHDPQSDAEALTELETRLADWLTVGGGGAWLRSLPEINKNLTK